MGLAHHMPLAARNLEYKPAVGLRMNVANVGDQSNDVAPFEVERQGTTEYRLEGAAVRARYRNKVAGGAAGRVNGVGYSHGALLIGRKRCLLVADDG